MPLDEDALYSVLDSKPRLPQPPESRRTPHGAKGPVPSCRALRGEEVPRPRGCHWKRRCSEAASSGIKAFGHSWGEYPLEISVVASGTEELPPLGQLISAVHGVFVVVFPLVLVCTEVDPVCVLVCEARGRQASA